MYSSALALFNARLVFVFLLALGATPAAAQKAATPKPETILRAYGPGGPAPAMREAASTFAGKKGIRIEIQAGPTSTWRDRARQDADLVFAGSAYMMTDFIDDDLPGIIDPSSVRTLYLRPSAILVRPGNPKGLRGVRDLAKPGVKILVVEGAGQIGMWEDVAGRTGDRDLVESVRRNIGYIAPNSGDAKQRWSSDASYDAWLVWTIWQKENPAAADLIGTEPEHTIYRPCSIALTRRATEKTLAREFVDFLQSDEGRAIFVKWGWRAP